MRSLILLLALTTPAVAQQATCTLGNRLAPVRSAQNLSNADLALQLDTCLTQIALLQQEVATMRGQCSQCQSAQPGKPGLDGKPGADGKGGTNGKDATVDYPKIWKWLTDNKDKFVGPDGKPATLPAFTVNFLDGDGKVARTEPVTDGKINIPAQKAWWTRLDGKTEKQSRPLGDALKFQTELRQAKPQGAK